MFRVKSILWRVVFTLLMISCSTIIYGQDHIVFEQLSTEDGLSNGTINSIFRDSHGFMWFCTDDGLCRYDGYNFKIYKSEGTNNFSIQNIQFLSIVEDSFNHLWIGTSEGLYYYDKNRDRVVPFSNFSDLELENNPIIEMINCLYFDTYHFLWVGSLSGVSRIKIASPDIRNIKLEDMDVFTENSDDTVKISNNSIFSFYEDSQHQIWISSNSDQLDCYNYQKQNFFHHKIEIQDIEKWLNLSKIIKEDANNDFWIATKGFGLIYWEREKGTFTQFKNFIVDNKSIDVRFIKSFMIDDRDRIWIGTDGNGLVVFDKKKNVIQHFSKNRDDQSKLSSNAIYSIYEDSTGIFWIGTYLMGLNKFVSNKMDFGGIYCLPYSEKGLSFNIVTGFCEDKNNQIWISTDGGGLNLFDRETYHFKHFKHDPDDAASISTNTTMAIFCDNNNDIWIGTYNGGLNRFNQKTQTFDHYWHNPNDSTSISSNHPWGFEQDKSNNLWVATVDAGLNLLKPGSTSFIRYNNNRDNYFDSTLIHSNSLTQLFIDNNNCLWIGSEYGLDRVDLNQVDFSVPIPKLIFKHYLVSDTTNSISYNRISCINKDDLDNLWIGTKGGGLNKLDLKTDTFTSFTIEDGLPHNIINGILFDDDNNPWISTNNGLSYFNTKLQKFKNYNISDGLQANIFVKTSCFETSDGMFLYGGINGLNAFYPEKITSKVAKLTPVITDFNLFNRSIAVGEKINERIILDGAISEIDEINLFYKENSIAFEFSALDYSNPEKIYYAYKLNGFDKDWQITNAKMRIAKYTNLAPGDYLFSVKASTNEENWRDTETSIRINIRPPWWKTLLFKIAVIILAITFWIVGFSIRVNSLEKQKNKLKLKVEEKTIKLRESNMMKDKFMSIIAHDLINPFNTILGFSDLLITNYSNWNDEVRMSSIKTINESSTNLFELLGNLLQWSRSERGLLEYSPEKIDLNNCIQNTISLESIIAKTKKITISTEFSDETFLVKSDNQLLNAILRNLISNAVKFTPVGGKITINTKRNKEYIIVSVIDNGVGISKDRMDNLFRIDLQQSTEGTNDEKGTGLGLFLIKEFVSKQKGTLDIISKVGKGSTFSFTIPCWIE